LTGSPQRQVAVSVTPGSSLFDQPVHMVVTGLDPAHTVTVGLRSADHFKHVWTSQAVLPPVTAIRMCFTATWAQATASAASFPTNRPRPPRPALTYPATRPSPTPTPAPGSGRKY